MSDEHPNIADSDWRFKWIGTAKKDYKSPSTGTVHQAGTPVYTVTFIKYKNETVGIPLPDPAAMYLSLAMKASRNSSGFIKNELLEKCVTIRDGTKWLEPDKPSHIFDIVEDLVATLVFSFTSLEVFANSKIPDNFQYIVNRDDGKCVETYNKEQTERFIKLDTKLDEILPPICSVSSPKGTSIWENYIWLKNFRDRLIHLKSGDWKSSDPNESEGSLWSWLFAEKVLNAPNIAFELIKHYFPKGDETPRWIKKYPHKLTD